MRFRGIRRPIVGDLSQKVRLDKGFGKMFPATFTNPHPHHHLTKGIERPKTRSCEAVKAASMCVQRVLFRSFSLAALAKIAGAAMRRLMEEFTAYILSDVAPVDNSPKNLFSLLVYLWITFLSDRSVTGFRSPGGCDHY
jgi:hypothetical protein